MNNRTARMRVAKGRRRIKVLRIMKQLLSYAELQQGSTFLLKFTFLQWAQERGQPWMHVKKLAWSEVSYILWSAEVFYVVLCNWVWVVCRPPWDSHRTRELSWAYEWITPRREPIRWALTLRSGCTVASAIHSLSDFWPIKCFEPDFLITLRGLCFVD